MKRKLLITIASLFCMTLAFGQGGSWDWARLFDTIGGINTEGFHMNMAVDDSNNLYVAGVYRDVDVKIGTETLENVDRYDIFLCSFDPVGNFRWATSIGSNHNDDIGGLIIDGTNLYIAGSFKGDNVYFTDTDSIENDDHYDAFVAHYNTDGTFQEFKPLFWGNQQQRLRDMEYDRINDYLVFIAQYTEQLAYDNGVEDDTVFAQGAKDFVIARYDISTGFGNLQFNDLKTFSSDQSNTNFKNVNNSVNGVTQTGYFITGDLYGTAWFSATDSIIGLSTSTSDVLIVKLDENLDFDWARRGGASGSDHANSANSDKSGNIYLAGKYESNVTFDSTATKQSSEKPAFGAQDLYVAKYNLEGRLLWMRVDGDIGNDDAFGMAVSHNYIQVAGNVSGSGNTNTGFIRYDIDGTYVNRGEIFGDGEDIGKEVIFDSEGNTFITGYFNSATLDFGSELDPDTTLNNTTGTYDGFIGKYQYPLTIVREQVDNVSCNADNDGYIELRGEFGVPPYSWSWEHEANTTPIASDLVAGTYIVTITDSDVPANVLNDTITITEPTKIVIDRTITDVNCFNGTDGEIDITPSGGIMPYTYFWSGGTGLNPTEQDQTGLRADNYTVRVTDDNDCFLDSIFTISQPTALVIDSVVKWDISSCAAADGSAKVYVSGGTPEYTYLWTGGGTTDSIGDLDKGSYSAEVTDANGCQKTSSLVSIFDPCEIGIEVVSVTNVACYDSATGVIQLQAFGGLAPYTFTWTPDVGHTDSIAAGLVAGNYKIVVTDSDAPANKDSVEIEITEPPQLFASAIRTDVICFGDATGEINLSVSGGTPPYSYDWSNGSDQEDLSNLVADNYSVTITDDNGCELDKLYPIFQNNEIRITDSTVTSLDCYEFNIGSIDITVTGGVPPYNYYWLEENWNPDAGLTNEDIDNLFAGRYDVTITDDTGCFKLDTFIVSQPEELFVFEDSVKPSCPLLDNGEAWVVSTGGNGGYTYVWTPSAKTGDHVTNMPPQDYVVEVTDSKSCTGTTTITIPESPAITILLDSIVDVLCEGYDSGAVYITPGGGTAPLTFEWDNPDFSTTEDLMNVPGASYRVTITDAAGCLKLSDPYTVDDLGTPIVYEADTVGNLSCFGDNDGMIRLSEVSGNTPFTFSVDSGMVYHAGAEFTGLSAGKYYVFVKDVNGCVNIPDTAITVSEPDAISISYIVTPVICAGGDDGEISVTPSGGTPGYTYLWSPGDMTAADIAGLMAGEYTVTVTDANDCSVDSIITMIELPALEFVSIAVVHETDTALGSITISITGGSPFFDYDIVVDNELNSVDTTFRFGDLEAAVYPITVTDNNECEIDSTVEVMDLTGIFDKNYFDEVNIYPNPTSGQLTVEINNPQARDRVMEIVNLQGQLIMKRELEYNGQPRFVQTIDLGDVKGTYFMRVDGLPVNTKIIVE